MNVNQLEELLEARRKATDAFVDKVSTLSTALLALSITFRKEIVGAAQPEKLGLFKWALLCFILSTAFGTLWKVAEMRVLAELQKQLVQGAAIGYARPPFWLRPFPNLATFLFLFGLGLLTRFAWLNIK